MNPQNDNIKLAAEIATLVLFLVTVLLCLCAGYSGALYLIMERDKTGSVNWLEAVVTTSCFLAPLFLVAVASMGIRLFFWARGINFYL